MVGLLVSLIIFFVYWVVCNLAITSAFLTAATFLFWWFVVCSTIGASILLLVTLGLVGAGAFAGQLAGGLIASGVSVLAWLNFIIRNGLLVVGAYLLSHAGTHTMNSFEEFDIRYLVGGVVVLFLGLVLMTSGKKRD